ncbi:hypothetical protein SORBI_3010G246800 [Sorghum bicolor]|uniref:Uncharacterized protein n=1 Tax=Sorghum bicolor TaxID=4558 RepID=A0A194YLB3_SORBI|nr:hypothetical protein SORBI_3010G246800 [Sorghum bicolor]
MVTSPLCRCKLLEIRCCLHCLQHPRSPSRAPLTAARPGQRLRCADGWPGGVLRHAFLRRRPSSSFDMGPLRVHCEICFLFSF